MLGLILAAIAQRLDPLSAAQVARALAGHRGAARALFDALLPIIQRRVFIVLRRRAFGRDAQQEVLDLTQEVCVALFANEGRALSRWDPGKGASLATWVGRIAEHTVASVMRSGRRNPWSDTPMESGALEHVAGAHDAPAQDVHSRDELARILDELRAQLSPLGYGIFVDLFVEERDIQAVCDARGMTLGALYVWRTRLRKAAIAAREAVMKESPPSAPIPSARRPS